MALNERETHYEIQIKEYQTKRDQAVRETQDLRNEFIKLQEEKTSNEKQLNDSINTLKQDFEKQIQSFQTQFTDKDEQIKEYQLKLNQGTNEFQQEVILFNQNFSKKSFSFHYLD